MGDASFASVASVLIERAPVTSTVPPPSVIPPLKQVSSASVPSKPLQRVPSGPDSQPSAMNTTLAPPILPPVVAGGSGPASGQPVPPPSVKPKRNIAPNQAN